MTGASPKVPVSPSPAPPTLAVDQYNEASSAAEGHEADFPQPLEGQPLGNVSACNQPARAAISSKETQQCASPHVYETSARIHLGPFDSGGEPSPGTEQFRFRPSRAPGQAASPTRQLADPR